MGFLWVKFLDISCKIGPDRKTEMTINGGLSLGKIDTLNHIAHPCTEMTGPGDVCIGGDPGCVGAWWISGVSSTLCMVI